MAIINFNYAMAIRQAQQVDAVADDMAGVADKQLQNVLDSIGVCWKGDASQQFVEYCQKQKTEISDNVKRLHELAARIREVARIIKEAEDRARELQSR